LSLSGAFTRAIPIVHSNARRAKRARRPRSMKMRMDIITQIYCRLNPPGYAAASPSSEERRTKRERCSMMPIDR
jgi:hypothetical protein